MHEGGRILIPRREHFYAKKTGFEMTYDLTVALGML